MSAPANDPNQKLIASSRAEEMKALTREGDALGYVHTFMLSKQSGRATHAVLALGGFLGINKSFYALPFELLAYDSANDAYRMQVDRQVLEGGPSWSNNAPTFDQAYSDRVASYYGVKSQDFADA